MNEVFYKGTRTDEPCAGTQIRQRDSNPRTEGDGGIISGGGRARGRGRRRWRRRRVCRRGCLHHWNIGHRNGGRDETGDDNGRFAVAVVDRHLLLLLRHRRRLHGRREGRRGGYHIV